MTIQHITEKELAKRWGISHRTLQRWRSDGETLPYIKIGGRVRYTIKAIEQYEASNTNESTGRFSIPPSLSKEPIQEGA